MIAVCIAVALGCVSSFSSHEECNEEWLRYDMVRNLQTQLEEGENGIGKEMEGALESSRSRRAGKEDGAEDEGHEGDAGWRAAWNGATSGVAPIRSSSSKKKKKNKGKKK